MPIRVLAPTVAAQIAAGEVVERPASVVKELLENALDAGATRVTVSVRGGGIDEIVLQDNGAGIPADEIELAFARHATSKLQTADDLWAIHTLGFRGEALPSIAAVAQVICQSRSADAATGAELRIASGEVQQLVPHGGAPGTTFTIRNLFYNVPVRREFLKSPAAEAAAIAAVVTQHALAYPQIAFTLVRDGKRVFQTSGRGQLADVILELYGVEVARQMLPVAARAGEDIGEVRIDGMVSAPSVTRSARDGMHITVNGRAIAPRGQVGAIVEEAYHTLLMKGRFPVVMLHIHLHPAAVDVNVHPTKSEVKFRNPLLVARTLGRAVRDAVQQTVVIQGWREPDGTPDDTGQPPARLEESGAPADVAASLAAETAGAPPAANASFDMTEFLPVPSHRLAADDTGSPSQLARQAELPRAADPGGPLQAVLSHTERLNAGGVEDRDKDPDAALEPLPEEARLRELPAPFAPRDLAPPAEPARPPTAGSQAATAPLSGAAALPPLRALAQLAQTYLLTEGPDGALYLIDQHAAHERVTYERLLAQHGAGVVQSQALLMPQYVALPPNAQQALLAAADDLAAWGFALNETSGGIQVLAVPAGLVLEELTPMLNDLAGHLSVGGGRTPSDRHDLLLATLACHTSVRAGQTLTAFEQQGLIDQLAGCEGPRTCPHGRPTVIVITKHQLERQFGRLGA